MNPDHPAPKGPAPPAYHYLGALVITAIVTGLAFFIKDPASKWIVLGVAVAMDLGIILAAVGPALRDRGSDSPGA